MQAHRPSRIAAKRLQLLHRYSIDSRDRDRREKLTRELETARERERAELQREKVERGKVERESGSERAETRYRVDPSADPEDMVQTFRVA